MNAQNGERLFHSSYDILKLPMCRVLYNCFNKIQYKFIMNINKIQLKSDSRRPFPKKYTTRCMFKGLSHPEY